jgi:hypothetical protein
VAILRLLLGPLAVWASHTLMKPARSPVTIMPPLASSAFNTWVVAQPVKSKLDCDSHRSRTRVKFVTCNTVVLLGTRILGPMGKFTRGALLFDEISTRKPQQGATSMTTRGRWRV